MIIWKVEHLPLYMKSGTFVFKRHECEWILPVTLAPYIRAKSNPRHLPVVVNKEMNDEAYYLYLSIRRILLGYRAHKELPCSSSTPSS